MALAIANILVLRDLLTAGPLSHRFQIEARLKQHCQLVVLNQQELVKGVHVTRYTLHHLSDEHVPL